MFAASTKASSILSYLADGQDAEDDLGQVSIEDIMNELTDAEKSELMAEI